MDTCSLKPNLSITIIEKIIKSESTKYQTNATAEEKFRENAFGLCVKLCVLFHFSFKFFSHIEISLEVGEHIIGPIVVANAGNTHS